MSWVCLLCNEKVQTLIRNPVFAVLVLSPWVAACCLEVRARAHSTHQADPVSSLFAIGFSRSLKLVHFSLFWYSLLIKGLKLNSQRTRKTEGQLPGSALSSFRWR